ncbi:MAG: hypothetical protein AABZ61_08460 [Bacteroidota bacterium]
MAGKFLAWWKTVPGILTAAAGIITALAGLIVALNQIGVFGGNSKQGSSMESKSEEERLGPEQKQPRVTRRPHPQALHENIPSTSRQKQR